MLPTLVYQNQYVNEHYGVPMCGLTFPSQWVEQVFFCLVVLLCYALPLLFIVLSYCFIFHTVSNRHMIGEDTAPRLSEDNGLARAKVRTVIQCKLSSISRRASGAYRNVCCGKARHLVQSRWSANC